MPEETKFEATLLHLVMPQNLNHHGTLFAGQISSWLVEAGLLLACQITGTPEDIVCVQINSLTFKKPINNGDLIELKSRVAHFGSTSMTIYSQVFRKKDNMSMVTNIATFVTVDKDNKPYRHGLKLSEEYIAANNDIYQEALKLRGSR